MSLDAVAVIVEPEILSFHISVLCELPASVIAAIVTPSVSLKKTWFSWYPAPLSPALIVFSVPFFVKVRQPVPPKVQEAILWLYADAALSE